MRGGSGFTPFEHEPSAAGAPDGRLERQLDSAQDCIAYRLSNGTEATLRVIKADGSYGRIVSAEGKGPLLPGLKF